ncbi:MAG TPA: rod-binding protein [Candidatus Acidoferrum sp.]|nr:rod-binding protein [Candidatus Acidoferrum sp.]
MEPVSSSAPLTASQQQALTKLHETAQQMESLFVDMLFKEMRKATPQESLTGKPSQAEQTFGEMLDSKRAEQLSTTGSLGIAKMIEAQLRSAVLGTVPPSAPAPSSASREVDKQ